MWSVETFALTKRFALNTGWRGLLDRSEKAAPAVDAVDLCIAPGELFGLLGPNGAGKTTLIKMLATLIAPTSGTARINGYDLRDETSIRASLGLVTSDERSFYWRLTGRQNLAFFARLHGLNRGTSQQRIETLLEQTGLTAAADQRFLTYSTGLRQRLSIARALLNQPRLLFLDEPTKGLDPIATNNLHQLVREDLVNAQGITILLTTHDLGEAERLCDRIAILHHGRIQAIGAPADLRRELGLQGSFQILVRNLPGERLSRLVDRIPELQVRISDVQATPGETLTGEVGRVALDLPVEVGERGLNAAIDLLRQEGATIQAISSEPASLERVFVHHTSQSPDAPGTPHPSAQDPTASTIQSPAPAIGLPPPAAPRFWQVAQAFLKRDLVQEASYRVSFFLQFFSVIISVLVFYFISELLGETATPYLLQYGGDYFAFVLIGIALLGYFSTGLSSFAGSLRHAQTTGTLEAMLTTPTRLSTIIVSSSLWDYLVTTLRVLVFFLVGSLLAGSALAGKTSGSGNYLDGNLAGALVILALTIITASSIGILSASFIMVIKRGDPISWGFGALSGVFGGVYFPATLLPRQVAWLSYLLPITYSLDGMRLALLQGAGWGELWLDILALGGFTVVMVPLSLLAFRFAVRWAKAEGSLTQY